MLNPEVTTDPVNILEQKYYDKLQEAEWLNRKLVSNQGNREITLLNWCVLKEGFSYELVVKLIRRSKVKPGDTFLDPFSGAGTSLFAAANIGLKSIGIELLPIGQFLNDTRHAAFDVNTDALESAMKNALEFIKKKQEPI